MTDSADNARAWLHLLRAGIGAAALRKQTVVCGSATAALECSSVQWREVGADADAIRALANTDASLLAADIAWLEKPNHHLIGWDSPDYPALLRRIGSPPPALLVAGDPDLLWHPQIALVGSRHATAGGLDNATAFAGALARAGLVITSGLAEGVDAASHLAALEAGRPTIAVVGTGPDVAYPRRHAALTRRIVAEGAVVSEFLPGTQARREHFPRRNRIIAGLTLGTLVIEAAERSGALITARLAGESGREVFAVPGSIHNPLARGCHRLIRQGAALVEDASEVIEPLASLAAELASALRARLELPAGGDAGTARVLPHAGANDPEYAQLLDALGHDPVGIDHLAERTGLTVTALSSMLLLMELDGRVTAEHGRYAQRKSL
jgi:DNA processing protein